MQQTITLKPNELISKFVTFSGATKTITGFENNPTVGQLENMKSLSINVYDKLCEYFGCDIKIHVFLRTKKVNDAAGSDDTSQHIKGEAIDIDLTETSGITISASTANAVMYKYIFDNLPFDQIIWEHGNGENPNWVHVSLVSDNRRENRKLLTIIPNKGKPLHSKTWEGFLANKKILFGE